MNFDFPRYRNGHTKKPLPKPNVELKLSGSKEPFPEAEIRGFFANPIYAGVGPFPPLIPDEDWIHCAAIDIKEEGAEQFLVNMLYLLRKSLQNVEFTG